MLVKAVVVRLMCGVIVMMRLVIVMKQTVRGVVLRVVVSVVVVVVRMAGVRVAVRMTMRVAV